MNTLSISHIPEDLLERYAMGRLSYQDCDRLHRHLLHCPCCQILLKQVDEYVKVMKAALLISATSGSVARRKAQNTAWVAGA
jgi:hypothetical protein